jgi:hypothetical protein
MSDWNNPRARAAHAITRGGPTQASVDTGDPDPVSADIPDRRTTDVGECWMPGVFRQLWHWVPIGARGYDTPAGPTYYAIAPCNAPCMCAPGARTVWSSWQKCSTCLSAVGR